MEFAAITETLLIDADGVYDPGDVNDRMLLGMKCTMGEVELHVMAGSGCRSKRAAAERGELRTPLPVGYVHDEAGAGGRSTPMPRSRPRSVTCSPRSPRAARPTGWSPRSPTGGSRCAPTAERGPGSCAGASSPTPGCWACCKNPCYAGAYVLRPLHLPPHASIPDGTRAHRTVERPRAEWPVLINDHHEGYISWADYLANEAKLAANRTNAGARPPREGSALCQGIIACGSCGKPMRTNYHTDQRPAYECSRPRRPAHHRRPAGPSPRPPWTTAVTERLLAALNPTEVALALAAADEVTDRRPARQAGPPNSRSNAPATRPIGPNAPSTPSSRKTGWSPAPWKPGGRPNSPPSPTPSRPWPRPGTRCRRYPAEPNWRHSPPTCPALWHADTTSDKDRKRLLRTLIADVTLLPEPDHTKARIGIRWHTGAIRRTAASPARPPGTAKRSPSPAVDMVRPGSARPPTPATLAGLLNAAGLTTGHGRPFDAHAVQWIRHAYHIPAPNPYIDGEISVANTAGRLGCSIGVVYDWIETGKLVARRGAGNRLCISWTDQRRGRMPHPHNRIRAPQPGSPAHQASPTHLTTATLSIPAPPRTTKEQPSQPNSTSTRTSQTTIAGGAV